MADEPKRPLFAQPPPASKFAAPPPKDAYERTEGIPSWVSSRRGRALGDGGIPTGLPSLCVILLVLDLLSFASYAGLPGPVAGCAMLFGFYRIVVVLALWRGRNW